MMGPDADFEPAELNARIRMRELDYCAGFNRTNVNVDSVHVP